MLRRLFDSWVLGTFSYIYGLLTRKLCCYWHRSAEQTNKQTNKQTKTNQL